jgi:two-component system response regulator YesN
MLVDIQMPRFNGLQMIERLRSELPDMMYIIISGYDEFDFARQAINLGVKDYLLKPIKEVQLAASVAQIHAALDQRNSKRAQYTFAMTQLQRNMTVLREQFLLKVILGQLVQEEIDELLVFHELQQGYDHLLLLRINNPGSLAAGGEWDRQLLRFAMQNILEEKLAEIGPAVCSADLQNNLFALVRVDEPSLWNPLASTISGVIRQVFSFDSRIDQLYFGEEWSRISEQYNEWLSEPVRPRSRLTEQAIEYIENNFADQELSFRRLCDALYVSSSYLSKIFKQDTGETFVDTLNKIRIQKSLVLLANPHLRMYEVASQVGYKSQHYFSAAFKGVLGVAPSEYRSREHPGGR